MGRRSINTTKSGKYMNPTDQARKEARKKELKKNKKQRQMVRAAVLKGKDPQQILMELEKIDQMEYNVLQPSPLNEKVLKDKRKKLRDTLERVLKMYNKDDHEKWIDLKRLQVEYERKKTALYNYYEAVKNAQQVQIDDIPLPLTALPAELQAVFVGLPSQIPLPALAPPHPGLRPPQFMQPHHSILKKTSAYLNKDPDKRREPPGVPAGPPPELSDDDEPMDTSMPAAVPAAEPVRHKTIRFADEPELEEKGGARKGESAALEERAVLEEALLEAPGTELLDEDGRARRKSPEPEDKPRPSSLQQRMLAMAGQDIDQFMKEMEEVHRKRKADRDRDLETRLQALERKKPLEPGQREPSPPGASSAPGAAPHAPAPAPAPEVLPAPPLGAPRPAMALGLPGMPPMMFRPPPPRGVPALMGIRLPPGPPPGLPPRLGIRLPPGPPPGMPPRLLRPTLPPPPGTVPVLPPQPTNVLSAAPQLITRAMDKASGVTIQAGAQIRNLSADVTRFLPTALRVKRDAKAKKEVKGHAPLEMKQPEISLPPTKALQTKDDAYMQFMREMEGLL